MFIHQTFLLAFLLFFKNVFGDTPANCTYEDIQGSWLFYVGDNSHDNTLQCDESFKVVRKLRVELLFPDIVMDNEGNKGFWTMIYNQGFEVVVNGVKYFAFSKYEKSSTKSISYCNKTLPGWAHDATVVSKNWGCFYGEKQQTKVSPKISQPVILTSLYDRKYQPNKQFISAIKEAQKFWYPAVYEKYEKMTLREMMYRAGGPKTLKFPPSRPGKPEDHIAAEELPLAFDWRNVDGVNYVSPIRNQKGCGSCYAFGTMAMFEARSRIKSNNSLQYVLAPQDIVSCSEYSQGCEGGFPYLIAKYAVDFGLVEESCYPYKSADSNCSKTSCVRHYGNNDYHYVGGFYGACSEPLMRLELVKNGPVAVNFEVLSDFLHYKGGIYVHTGLEDKFNPFETTNHAVLAIGYGVDSKTGMKYWIVKNSWGPDWGEDGFFRIRRGTDEVAIESIASAATVNPKF